MVYRIGIAPLSLKTIESITGVSKSTCNDIYKHALKNATAGRQNLHLERDRDRQQAACASAEEADVFLAGIEAQLNKINTEPGPGLEGKEEEEEKEEEIPLVTPLVDGYHRGAGKAMAKALPCVSPHNDARVELPQAYVVSGLCASHYAVILQTSRCLSLVIAI